MRRDQVYVGRKMMEMELPGKRKRVRPKRRFLDVKKEDVRCGTLVCRERSPGMSRKILEKNYLGTSNFAVLVHEFRRERKIVSSDEDLFFRNHRDFGTKN